MWGPLFASIRGGVGTLFGSVNHYIFASASDLLLPPWGLPRSSAKILLAKVCLFVCVSGFRPIFTEWHMRRLQTQMPFVFFGGGSEEGPSKTTFKQGSRRFPGHGFFELFYDF